MKTKPIKDEFKVQARARSFIGLARHFKPGPARWKCFGALALWAFVVLVSKAQADFRFTLLAKLDGTTQGGGIRGLVQGSDGNFYGSTIGGGACFDCGTIFRMTPAGALTTVVNPERTNGHVSGPLIQATDGAFYGVQGISVIRLTTNGDLSVVGVFNPTNSPNEPYYPNSPLVQGLDGNFYGTTQYGLGDYLGTVFKITPAGDITTLITLMATNGYFPTAGLTLGSDGNFYGTTSGRDQFDEATVFKITPEGTFTTLVHFALTDDDQDTPGLVLGHDGNLYGTTTYGATSGPGKGVGNGTVFRITPEGALTILARFTNGSFPLSGTVMDSGSTGLVQGPDGNFYGTLYGTPTLYQMTPDGVITTIVNLPDQPAFGPILGHDGNLYGATIDNSIYRLVLPPVFQGVTKVGTNIILTWRAAIGQNYQPQYTTSLLSTNWTSLGAPITATNLTVTVSDSPGSNTRRFYRVQLLP